MNKTILTAAITSLIVNLILNLSPIFIFLIIWAALGFLARRISSYTHMKDDKLWNYVFCNIVPPISIAIMLPNAWEEVKEKIQLCFSFPIPSIRNPFVWPEKNVDKSPTQE